MKKRTKLLWDGKPLEDYTKKQLIEIMYEILDMLEVSISKEAVDYINRLIQQRDKDDKQ